MNDINELNEKENMDVDVKFNPSVLKPFARNEVMLNITLKNNSNSILYWGECDINVQPPLSLASDIDLNAGRMRIGILKPNHSISKPARIYTRLNNYPDDYVFKIIAYFYDEDGAIVKRIEKNITIPCIEQNNGNNMNTLQV
ncbi:MAG: hypothetical protein ACP5UN_03350 [Candidatus Micrarchaeia archaeon]